MFNCDPYALPRREASVLDPPSCELHPRIKQRVFTWDGNTLLLEKRFEQPVMPREERIAQFLHTPAPLGVICEEIPNSDPLPVAQRQHQFDVKQWRGMSMYLYEPDSFTPLARLEQTLEEPARITLGPDGEFTEHPVKTTHATYFYQNDHLGTPQELVDEEGEIVWLGKYRAWGELRSATQGNRQPSQIRNALHFQGQYCDDETGLHYNLNRYYDPASGRFISKDPIGLEGGINLYQYAPNPVTWVDPLGLKCGVPFGFKSFGQFKQFGQALQAGLSKAGFPGAASYMQGSAASGVSFSTGQPFDAGRVSDFDVAISHPDLYQKAEALGLGKGGRTGPIEMGSDVAKQLGIDDTLQKMSKMSGGRDVNAMIFASPEDVKAKNSNGIRIPGKCGG